MPTSPYIHGLPVPSTMRPFWMITSYATLAGFGATLGAGRAQPDSASTEPITNENGEAWFLQRIKAPVVVGGSWLSHILGWTAILSSLRDSG
jgi:hypothetical protein